MQAGAAIRLCRAQGACPPWGEVTLHEVSVGRGAIYRLNFPSVPMMDRSAKFSPV